jgi:hypothetical protein
MAWQLIYTSAPRGLVPGRSGFCTVARHREIRDGLVTAIERFSQYDRSGRGSGVQSPVVYAHRIVRLGGSIYHVLSCTRDAGADYTGRTNHIAHHLICEPHELANAPSPAEVLGQMAWHRTWTDAPRYLPGEDAIDLQRFHRTATLPAQTWQALTGDAGCAALPLESGALAGCYWLYPAEAGEHHLLPLFAESLLLLDPSGRGSDKLWQVPFTTYLQTTDHTADFFWRGCWQGSPAAATAQGARQTIDFALPRNLRPPKNETAELARTGRSAASETTEIAPVSREAPVEIGHLESPADSGGHEFDLAALLASADNEPSTKRAWTNSAATVSSEQSNGGRGGGTRKSSLKLIIGVAVVMIVCGALALGFGVWRDGKAEKIVTELSDLRKKGDFSTGPKRVATIWGIFKGYEPLKIEIERTLVAAELDGLKDKTPGEASKHLNTIKDRPYAAEIRFDRLILERIEKIERWRDMDKKLITLKERIAAETFREPAAIDAIKKSLTELESAISTLDAPYRPTVSNQLVVTRRLYVGRRLETLEQTIDEHLKDGELSKDKLAVIVSELTKDAERWAPELRVRIEGLYKPKPQPTPPPTPESPDKPTVVAPVAVKAEKTKVPTGLPEMTTYIAIESGKRIDISGVEEMRLWTELPSGKTISLFLQPKPPLNPPMDPALKAAVTATVSSNGKLYDGGTALLALQRPALAIHDDKAKEHLGGSFGLLFAGTSDRFYVYCMAEGGISVPLATLPAREGLLWNREKATIALSAEVATALSRIKLASKGQGALFFKFGISGCGDWNLPVATDAGMPIGLDETIKDIERMEQESLNPIAKRPSAKSREEEARDAGGARDILMSKDDRMAKLGLSLFDKTPLKLSKENPLDDTKTYIKSISVQGMKPVQLTGRVYAEYTRAIFNEVAIHLKNKWDEVTEDIKQLESQISDEKDLKKQAQLKDKATAARKRRGRIRQLGGIITHIVLEFDNALSKVGGNGPGLNVPSCSKIIRIWKDFASSKSLDFDEVNIFHENWKQVFTPENIERIRPFLEWNPEGKADRDLDTVLNDFTKKQTASIKPVEAKFAVAHKKVTTDFLSLAPFAIILKTADGHAIPVIDFIESPSENVAEAVEPSK